jgi:F-box/leucine-rich repeat protein 17
MSARRSSRLRALHENRFDRLPDEIVLAVFSWVALLDPKVMLTGVHAVCRRWRQLCGDTHGVRFDFTFLPPYAKLWCPPMNAAAEATMVASLSALAGRFKHVVEVNLHEVLMHSSADSYAIALLERCPRLTAVNFAFCHQLTDASVVALAKHCPLLTAVDFTACGELTDASVVALAKQCPLLTAVDFSACGELTDASVVALAKGCPMLSNVNFAECNQLTDASVFALAEDCPRLTIVNFRGCNQLTDASVVALDKGCPRLFSVNWDDEGGWRRWPQDDYEYYE